MSRKQIAFAFCALAIMAVVIVYGRGQVQKLKADKRANPPQAFSQEQIYEQMFRHYIALRRKADAAEQAGQESASIRSLYKRQAKITDAQANQLDAIATDCVSQLEKLDARAKQVIDQARAQVPGGQLKKGEEPPPPPAELKALQRARDAKVLEAVNKLRSQLGESEFARFDEFVKRTIAGSMKSSAPGDRQLPVRPLQERASQRQQQ